MKEIVEYIDKKSKRVGLNVASKLKAIYLNWLHTHSLKDPEKWAEDRLKHNGDSPTEVEKEFKHWTQEDFWKKDNFTELNKMPEFSKWLQLMSKDDVAKTLHYVLRFSFKESMRLLKKYDILYHDVLLEFYKVIIFPQWKKYWKKEGLEKTYNRLEKMYEDLVRIHLDDVPKMFATINKALNEVHQTGEMMDYVQMGYGVSKADLDTLSNANIKKWDHEISQMLPE